MKAIKNKLVAALLSACAILPIVVFPGVDGSGSAFLLIIAAMIFFAKR